MDSEIIRKLKAQGDEAKALIKDIRQVLGYKQDYKVSEEVLSATGRKLTAAFGAAALKKAKQNLELAHSRLSYSEVIMTSLFTSGAEDTGWADTYFSDRKYQMTLKQAFPGLTNNERQAVKGHLEGLKFGFDGQNIVSHPRLTVKN